MVQQERYTPNVALAGANAETWSSTDRSLSSPESGLELSAIARGELSATESQAQMDLARVSASPRADSNLGWVEDFDNFDRYADRLMDDLFEDVEHVLETGATLPEVPEEEEVLSIQTISMPPVSLPPALIPRVDAYTPQDGAIQTYATPSLESRAPLLFDRLLWGAVLLSCAITVTWWAVDRDRYATLLGNAPPPDLEQVTPTGDSTTADQQEFVAYLQNSLEALDQNPQSTTSGLPPQNPAANSIDVGSALPSVVVPGTPNITNNLQPATTPALTAGALPAPPTTALEQVYIPVYPNTPGSAQPPSTVVGALPGVLNPAPPLIKAGNLPASVPVGAPVAVPASPSQPASAGNPQISTPGVAPIPNPATNVPHTLVGILELGDRSAALFQINGVTRRVHLGEAIGSGGWMLVEVKNQEAVIRRNGEVRSVYIGQNF